MSLPQKLPFPLHVTTWAKRLDPIVANPIIQGLAVTAIVLDANKPLTIPTGLSRIQQGWFITDILSAANVWRTQPFNSNNITLESDADTTISIWVF